MKKSTTIKQYYKQQQFNVMQTALENLEKFSFLESMNLSSDVVNELHRLGYKIVKKAK